MYVSPKKIEEEEEDLMATDQSMTTIATTAIVSSIVLSQFIPAEFDAKVRAFFINAFRSIVCRDLTVVIPEFDRVSMNSMYEACNVYVSSIISDLTYAVKLTKPDSEGEEMAVTVDTDQVIRDSHGDIPFTWIRTHCRYGYQCFQVSVDQSHSDYALKVYFPYVWRKAKEIKANTKKTVSLHTVDCTTTSTTTITAEGDEKKITAVNSWISTVVNHPATIETMAMDPTVKEELVRDLDLFVTGKDYYRRVGKAWKRGYLFYGPPGTGKSSLIAAMANYLKFDIFDLDLKAVTSNAHLRTLLLSAANRSILVIEDIDCSTVSLSRGTQVADDKITLSGLLNLIDGLWSCCGEGRIIVFTTNHKERLDPALRRPGRMDVQLEMSYCTFPAFKILASNYLGVDDHPLFPEIDHLFTQISATPAQIAGELMKNRRDVDAALLNLIRLFRTRD